MKPISLLAALAVAVISIFVGSAAHAERRTFIRDAEIENILRDYASPIFQAAGLVPDAINIYIVKDPELNAFVMGGQNLFINTGLLTAVDNAGQLIGVIAHETGHIAGGHLARRPGAVANARATSMIATLLGAAVALGTGRGDAASLIMQGGEIAGTKEYLQFSRTQEASADNAALKYLDRAGISAEGMLQFMYKLEKLDKLYSAQRTPYLMTHPLTRDRILTVENHVEHAATTGKPLPPRFVKSFKRMKAKLIAFLEPYARVMQQYPESDKSVAARYAHAIATYREPDMPKALKMIDALIADYPLDPYFHELKGQALFENGHPKAALVPYEAAVRLLPTSSLLLRDLGRVQIETGDPHLLDSAIANLNASVQRDSRDVFAWHELAIAEGKKGDMGHSALALAEEAIRAGQKQAALYQAGKVKTMFPRGSIEWLRAEDIIEAANVLGKQ